jgi:hypothetical protein
VGRFTQHLDAKQAAANEVADSLPRSSRTSRLLRVANLSIAAAALAAVALCVLIGTGADRPALYVAPLVVLVLALLAGTVAATSLARSGR